MNIEEVKAYLDGRMIEPTDAARKTKMFRDDGATGVIVEVDFAQVFFGGELRFSQYEDGRTRVDIFNNRGPGTTYEISNNETDQDPAEDCFWLKNWGSNIGAYEALKEAGIIEPTGETAYLGMFKLIECRVIYNLLNSD